LYYRDEPEYLGNEEKRTRKRGHKSTSCSNCSFFGITHGIHIRKNLCTGDGLDTCIISVLCHQLRSSQDGSFCMATRNTGAMAHPAVRAHSDNSTGCFR